MACWIRVDLRRQWLEIRRDAPIGDRTFPPIEATDAALIFACAISSGLNGIGEVEGSGCTPTGWHVIRAAIGATNPEGAVYRGRRYTGEIFSPELAAAYPTRDWILTRILWLSGRESGINRGWNASGERVDSLRRYIYFHGTPASEPMGIAASHGCIRLRDPDLLRLFQHAIPGTPVLLHA